MKIDSLDQLISNIVPCMVVVAHLFCYIMLKS